MAECGYAKQVQGGTVAISYASVCFHDHYSRPYMVKHEAEIFLLLDNLMPFLVEYVFETVQCLVKAPADDAAFVETEIQLLVFKGVKHIGNFPTYTAEVIKAVATAVTAAVETMAYMI